MNTNNCSVASVCQKSFNTEPDRDRYVEVDRHDCKALSFTRRGADSNRAPHHLQRASEPGHGQVTRWRPPRLQSDGAPAPVHAHKLCPRRMRVAGRGQRRPRAPVCPVPAALPPCLASQFPVRVATATSFIGNGPGRTHARSDQGFLGTVRSQGTVWQASRCVALPPASIATAPSLPPSAIRLRWWPSRQLAQEHTSFSVRSLSRVDTR